MHVGNQMVSGSILQTNMAATEMAATGEHAIRDSPSPRPKMYWTRTFEGLVPSLGTAYLVLPFLAGNSIQYLYCSYENESL